MADEPSPGPRRRPVASALAVLALAAAVIAIVAVAAGRDSGPSTPRATTSRTTTSRTASTGRAGAPPTGTSPSGGPSTARALPVGITFGNRLFGVSRARIDRAFDDVVDLHMTWVRIDVSWASVQPRSADQHHWAPLDAIVASARSHRLTVLGLLSYTPAWARAAGCRTFACPPRSSAQFARFAGAVARRYRSDGLTHFQVWNEPNINLFWTAPDPVRYRTLLAATVKALRATGPRVRILFGGLAFAHDRNGDLSAATFLRRACAGRTCQVDAVGYDPYTYPALPGSTARPLNAFQLLTNAAAGAAGMPAALAAVGLGRTPVWITGFGAPTRQSGSADPRAVSEATQSRIVVAGLRLARADPARIGGYFVDTLRDSSEAGPSKNHFGLERYDGTHKPAFAALTRALAR